MIFRKKHFLISLSFLVLFSFYGNCQDSSKTAFFRKSPIYSSTRLKTLIYTETIIYTGLMTGLNFLWYSQSPRNSFHFFNDNKEWLQMDKLGHSFSAYYGGKLGYESLKWAGVNNKKALIYGGGLGFAFLTTVEIFDGFSTQWGASWGDVTANTLGASLFIVQQTIWKEQKINIKFSSHPSPFAKYRPNVLGSNTTERLIKDYNGQTYWLSFGISNFFNSKNKIPKWLNLAVGYSIEGVIGGIKNPVFSNQNRRLPTFKRQRQFLLSLDIDLTKIKNKSPFINTLLHSFGFIKIPFPTLELSNQKIKFHPLYF